ncbi:MAG TPA: hypothetical protein VE821_03080, partial [Pyrinomonadaceae bacterium]|nr:hypothetical protein [Pyrinomonadaceae bacterium]
MKPRNHTKQYEDSFRFSIFSFQQAAETLSENRKLKTVLLRVVSCDFVVKSGQPKQSASAARINVCTVNQHEQKVFNTFRRLALTPALFIRARAAR